MSALHSVRLNESLCRGCTNCLKSCPTEAIRVKNGKAFIIEDRCVDCGECIRRCPFRAKKAYSDSLDIIHGFDITVALPAPALYGQFPKGTSPNAILEGLRRLGFTHTLEVALAAESVSRSTRAFRAENAGQGPLISSSCPAVVRLLRNRFPDLLDRIVPLRSPMEIAARLARKRFGRPGRSLGVFFISPCAAKVTAITDTLGDAFSEVDGVIGIQDLWKPLRELVSVIENPKVSSESGFRGISWARAEGEAEGAGLGETLAADGIGAVLEVLEALEDDRLEGIGFLELMACPGGCVGGSLAVENPYLARSRIRALEEESRDDERERGLLTEILRASEVAASSGRRNAWHHDLVTGDIDLAMEVPIEPQSVFSLDKDYGRAVEKMAQMDRLVERLPGLDCGSCGAPSCRALAEDIVRGFAKETDCVFRLRDRIHSLTEEMQKLEGILPCVSDKDV